MNRKLFMYMMVIVMTVNVAMSDFSTCPVTYNQNVSHQKKGVCQCTTKYDHGCVLDTCEDVCIKIWNIIGGYCMDKSTCLCIYDC
ncbi:hypothetical protein ACET3Z_004656 [Daucus carota]